MTFHTSETSPVTASRCLFRCKHEHLSPHSASPRVEVTANLTFPLPFSVSLLTRGPASLLLDLWFRASAGNKWNELTWRVTSCAQTNAVIFFASRSRLDEACCCSFQPVSCPDLSFTSKSLSLSHLRLCRVDINESEGVNEERLQVWRFLFVLQMCNTISAMSLATLATPGPYVRTHI